VTPVRSSVLRAIADAAGRAVIASYFAVSYRILGTPAGRAFLDAARGPGAPAVHGYSTEADVEALIRSLRPSPDDVLVDLGCGVGEVAIAIHQRTGCQMIGVDASRGAIAIARRRAGAAGVADLVRFEVGNIDSRVVGGSAAYALDSLMFVVSAPDTLADVSRSLEPPGRVFATFVDHRGLDRDAFARFISSGGVRLEQLEDVTASLADESMGRSAAARRVYRKRPRRAGRRGLLLVLVEEAVVSWLIRHRRVRRWRLTVTQSD